MRFISGGLPQLRHDDLAHIDYMRALLCGQCWSGVRAEELIMMTVLRSRETKLGGEATYFEKECTSEACPNEEKVWCVWHVARRVHIIQP
jgi:hypothetical protein